MPDYTVRRETLVSRPLPEVFEFFSKPQNLERLTPEWLSFRILTPLPVEMRVGTLINYQLRVRGIPVHWQSEITSWNPPVEFVDEQIRGPYQRWRHTHRFSSMDGGTRVEDIVEYALPFGPLGGIAHRLLVERDLTKIFDYRAQHVGRLLGSELR
jgi:ligand-binding SRPBCC domain-containing protein